MSDLWFSVTNMAPRNARQLNNSQAAGDFILAPWALSLDLGKEVKDIQILSKI